MMGVIIDKVVPYVEYSATAAFPFANAAGSTFAGQHILNAGAIFAHCFLALFTKKSPLTVRDLEYGR